jgi:acyl-CoA reductase-like NAD-dependent aldehyde dehydrogenase
MEILNYINNEWTKPSVKEYFDVINPATGIGHRQDSARHKSGCGLSGESGE